MFKSKEMTTVLTRLFRSLWAAVSLSRSLWDRAIAAENSENFVFWPYGDSLPDLCSATL